MTLSDTLAIWGLVVSGAGLPVTVVGFWLAIAQLRKTTNAAIATKNAVESANKRMLYNHLLVLLPQLRNLEADLDGAISIADRVGAIKALVAFSHAANQIASLLETEPETSLGEQTNVELVGELRSTARAASVAKAEIVSGSKKTLTAILHSVSGEISDLSARCAGLSTTYQTKVA